MDYPSTKNTFSGIHFYFIIGAMILYSKRIKCGRLVHVCVSQHFYGKQHEATYFYRLPVWNVRGGVTQSSSNLQSVN